MFATRRRLMFTLLTVAAVFVVSVFSFGVYLWLKISPEYGDVPRLRITEWEFIDVTEGNPQLMLRRETTAGGALLLKRADLKTVYRYDPQTRSVKPVTDVEWENAGGQLAKCSDQRHPDPAVLRRDDRTHKLFSGNREIPTAGGFAIDELVSPSRKWVAVHSAAGPAKPSIIPLSGDVIYGQRYHEIMSFPDLVSVGKPVRVPADRTLGSLHPCWSADEKFVVYTDGNIWMAVVVDTGL